MSRIRIIVLWIVTILFSMVIAWRILATGMAEHYVRQASVGDRQAMIEKALIWNPKHPRALYLKGTLLMNLDPEGAEKLLRQSIFLNPGDAAPMVALSRLLLSTNNIQAADEIMDLAVQRMPASKEIRLRAANYWMKRQQPQKAIENWGVVLVLDPGQSRKIYPVLTRLAEIDRSVGALQPLAEAPPGWWDDFFTYLVKNTEKLETVVTLASIRQASSVPLSKTERSLLISRLQDAGHRAEAYLVWINGLDSKERRYLGSVFDGGFELSAANEGFGWYFPENNAWMIRQKHSYGAEGEKSLHILYKGGRVPAKQVFQPLLLSKGRHEMSMMSRVDRLRILGGLQWQIRCADDETMILGSSPRLVGASDWQVQRFKFEVPDIQACVGQILRLETVGSGEDYQSLEGEVLFDRISIRKLE